MKTFVPALAVAFLASLLTLAVYAADLSPSATTPYKFPPMAPYRFPPMVLPVAGPAVTPAFNTAASPQATSEPMAKPATPAAERQHLGERIAAIFGKAKEAFVKTDLKLAASEVRRGAAALRSEESKATPEVKKELAATALDLERLALRIEQAKVQAGTELDAAFARADHAAAQHNTAQGAAATKPATQSVTPRQDISATAAAQGMPRTAKEPMSAAYAAPEKSGAQNATPTYEDLSRRVDALSKDLATLQADLNRLKAQGAGMKN